jgi:hypothetical protein
LNIFKIFITCFLPYFSQFFIIIAFKKDSILSTVKEISNFWKI